MTVVSRPVNAHQSLTIGPALITFEPRFSLHPDNNPAVLRIGLVVPSMNSKTGSLGAVNASESKTQREREVESLGVSDPSSTSSDLQLKFACLVYKFGQFGISDGITALSYHFLSSMRATRLDARLLYMSTFIYCI